MSGFLTTILIILLVYFALRFFGRLLLPFLMRYIAKKATQKMEGAFKGFQQQASSSNTARTESEPVSKKSSKVVGEYIDFEEID
ncbi:MAG: DUF4834 domain-containing protein [Dokdonia sp.]|jgi:hypothetical protein|tara:strand:- start:530 stop:781 length:252 start_codon:yes stop_codon:yes gene_type:complete